MANRCLYGLPNVILRKVPRQLSCPPRWVWGMATAIVALVRQVFPQDLADAAVRAWPESLLDGEHELHRECHRKQSFCLVNIAAVFHPRTTSVVFSKRLGRQIFTVERNDCTLAAFGVVDHLEVELEINRANDAVAKFFVNQRLQR